MEGWIKIHRMIQSNDLWHCEPFSRGQAWIDLLLLANHKESFFYKRGNKVVVKRGQVGRSSVELSDRWKWSRTKVGKFLKDLEKEQQIIIHKSTVTQLITIVNYDVYQEKEQQTGQQKDNRKTAEEQQKDTYKNDKNIKNDNNDKNIKDIINNIQKPKNFDDELFAIFKDFLQMRKEIKKPFKSTKALQTRINTLSKDVDTFGIENVKGAIQNSIANQYQGIFVKGFIDNNPEVPKVSTYTPAYNLPTFKDENERLYFFINRFEHYKKLVEDRSHANTVLSKRAIYQKEAEIVCYELEQQYPHFAQMAIKWK